LIFNKMSNQSWCQKNQMSSNTPKAIAKRRTELPHVDGQDEQHWQDQRHVPAHHVDPLRVSLPLRYR
jgi:hypothetical protein